MATSLSVRIDAERQLTVAERAFIDRRIVQRRAKREHILARIGALQPKWSGVSRSSIGLVQQQYRESQRAELAAHDSGFFTRYAHLDDANGPPPVKVGDAVRAGDPIGWVGLTGITTVPHLHFVIRRGDERIDPSGLLPHS